MGVEVGLEECDRDGDVDAELKSESPRTSRALSGLTPPTTACTGRDLAQKLCPVISLVKVPALVDGEAIARDANIFAFRKAMPRMVSSMTFEKFQPKPIKYTMFLTVAPGDMISVDPAAIRCLQEPGSSRTESEYEHPSDSESKSESSGPSQPNPSAKTTSTKSSLTPFHLPPYTAPFIFVPHMPKFPSPPYLTARPGYDKIPTPNNADGELVRLAWDWYSKM
ncbi:uncharacterized protein EDB91DRAFT_1251208 [Suillus paluster]|uniref:uncharacterized protein n=1 Tax=Suillus paluster TaxID=48578 RepID=UPI001B87BB56|nr:uncharacterized protein EDB91DRAFT_1251208 [Suillus paluster]KAG1733903.1 hypothetical protein EDB91DRAFT_1251208 [Suillus paluster]